MRISYRSRAGVREAVADLGEAFERMGLTPFEILDAGDRAVFLGHFHLRSAGSGVELDSPFAQALWVERGLIARDNTFFDWDAGLRAAGIPTDAPGDHGPRYGRGRGRRAGLTGLSAVSAAAADRRLEDGALVLGGVVEKLEVLQARYADLLTAGATRHRAPPVHGDSQAEV